VRRAIIIIAASTFMAACSGASEEAKVDENSQTHTELTPAILASIPDQDVEQAVFDYVTAKIGNDYEHEVAIVAKLPTGAQALYITWLVDGEVNNGGFNQFYWNASGQFTDQAAEAFEFFSAHEHAALMREANSVRAMEVGKMKKFKDRGSLEAFSESYKESQLRPVDDKYYALKEDLSKLRIAKIRSMPDFFSGK
jgi:hypothetical protein